MEIEDQEQEIMLEPELYAEVGNGTLTVQKNSTTIGTFTANQKTDTTIDITVPVATSELTNDADFQNANDLASAISQHNQSTSAHQDIRQAITDEENARINADNALQGQIDAITAASDVVDIVGTYAELQAYDTQHLKDNDVIKVLQDETHNDAMTYYRWSTHTETWTYIGAEGPYYTKSETNTLLDDKLDKSAVPDGFFDGAATVNPTPATSVEIENSIKLKSIELQGDTVQNNYTGKNLWGGFASAINSLNGSINWTNNTDGTISALASTATGTSVSLYSATAVSNNHTITLQAGTYTLSGGVDNNIGVEVVDTSGTSIASSRPDSATFTLNNTTSVFVRGYVASGTAISDLSLTPMLEAGSTPTPYEPYVGGIPAPNPSYPQAIQSVTGEQNVYMHGKNLWGGVTAYSRSTNGVDFTTNADGTITASGTASANAYSVLTSAAYGAGVYIALEAGTYTLSEKNNNIVQAYEAASGSTVLADTSTSTVTFTLTEPKNILVRAQVSNGTAISGTMTFYPMLEAGSPATDYEPYQGATYTVDLGATELCKIGEYQDYIYKSGDDWYIHKDTVKAVFDGTENWNYGSISSFYRGSLTFSGWKPSQQNFYNSHFIAGNTGNMPNVCGIGSTQVFMSMDASLGVTTKAQWLTWLSNNNVTMYTILDTPTDTQITDDTLIGQLEALLRATIYQPTTTIAASGTLPAILNVEAFTDNLNSILEIAAQPDPEQIIYEDFVGTDGVNAGTAGLVPAPAATDAGKFLKADGTWDTAGGGGGDTVYSDKTTSNGQAGGAVYIGNLNSSQVEQPDPTTTDNHYKYFWAMPETNSNIPANYSVNIMGRATSSTASHFVAIGQGAQIDGNYAASGVTIGQGSYANGNRAVALGGNTYCANAYSVALGGYAKTSRVGEVNVGTGTNNYGYNSTQYRVIGGVHDGQLAQDAVTVNQVNATIDAINTALGTSIPHIGA